MSGSATEGLVKWHNYLADSSRENLRAMLADGAVFHSPVVHTPQVGADKVFAYLHAASIVLGGGDFKYVRELVQGNQACLEFTRTLDGILINGVDLIRWDEQGRIDEFKVLVRPLKAVNKLWELMAAQLQAK